MNDSPKGLEFASRVLGAYHEGSMAQPLRRLSVAFLLVFLLAGVGSVRAADTPATFPLSEVKPGMKGVCTPSSKATSLKK